MDWMPKTTLGTWSLRCSLAVLILLAFLILLSLSGQEGGDKPTDNLLLAIPAVCMWISGIIAFITGIISMICQKERSIFVFISTFIGCLTLFFLLGEILIPH